LVAALESENRSLREAASLMVLGSAEPHEAQENLVDALEKDSNFSGFSNKLGAPLLGGGGPLQSSRTISANRCDRHGYEAEEKLSAKDTAQIQDPEERLPPLLKDEQFGSLAL
jgi:hypothetical protein